MRGLEAEFGESSNGIRMELNRLEQANMLNSRLEGNRKLFTVNQEHPLYKDIHNIVRKFTGLDVIVDIIAKRLGKLESVYLTGDICKGIDSQIVDLIFVGDIDFNYLVNLTNKAEGLIKRKINYQVYDQKEAITEQNHHPVMLLWQNSP